MEVLRVKLGDAESRLQHESSGGKEGEVRVIVNRLADEEDQLRRAEQAANSSVLQQPAGQQLSDKERMILMQQRKIASLDEANSRLVHELSRLGDKLEKTTRLAARESGNEQQQQQQMAFGGVQLQQTSDPTTPKTVEELIDSLHSTPI
jgi:hypothetical protein